MGLGGRKTTIAVAMVLLSGLAMACGDSASGEPTSAPTATITPTTTPITADSFPATATPTRVSAVDPYPTSTPLPPTPTPMQVVWLSEIPEPVSGTIFEELLARIPDDENTRRLTMLADQAGVMEFLGLEIPDVGASEDQLLELFRSLTRSAEETGFAVEIPVWPLQSRGYLSAIIGRFEYVGFEHWAVTQTVNAGVPPELYDFAFGDFDPQRTADTLDTCNCDQPDIREYSGVEYYAWGPEFIGDLTKRNNPPLYDHVGRGPRLFLRPGEGFYSVSDHGIESFIDVVQGNIPSLADADEYLAAARALASLGLMRDMRFVSLGLSVEEAREFGNHNQALLNETIRTVDLMRPFDLIATGVGFDGESAFTGVVIVNPDESTAKFNAERLEDRVQNVPVYTSANATLADFLARLEIIVDGNLILARLYDHVPERTLYGLPLTFNNTVFLYE